MNDKQELEQFLISTLQDGFPGELTAMYKDTLKESREERLEEELCLLLETCSIFQSDPVQLQAAIRRHLVGIVNRLVKESTLPDYVETAEAGCDGYAVTRSQTMQGLDHCRIHCHSRRVHNRQCFQHCCQIHRWWRRFLGFVGRRHLGLR